MKKFNIILVLIAIVCVISCGHNANYKSSAEKKDGSYKSANNAENSSQNDEETENKNLEGTTWFYSQHKDDLTGDVVSLHAHLISNEYKEIDYSNHMGRMAISLMYGPDASRQKMESSVTLTFIDDNRLCRFADRHSSGFLAVFDDGSVDDTWGFIYLDDEKRCLIINPDYSGPNKVKAFIDKLKKSKQCKIQVCLKDVGNTTFTFNTAGLKWDFDN